MHAGVVTCGFFLPIVTARARLGLPLPDAVRPSTDRHRCTTTGFVPAASGASVSATRDRIGTARPIRTVQQAANPATNVTCSASSCTATSPPGSDTVFVTVHTSGGTSGNTAAGLFNYKSTATLSISTTGSGTVSGASPGSYPLGAAITLTASPGSGYVFSSWTVDGAATGSANPYTLMMDRDHAVVAKFTPVPGSGPTSAVSPSSLAFGSQLVGTASSPQTVTLTNSAGAPLSITKIALGGANPGQFTRSSACPSTLAAGASCQINVAFKPSSRGGKSAVLSISDNAPNSPQTVALTGQGVAPVVGLSTSWLSFSDQRAGTTSAAKTVIVRNKGDAPLTISSITISGDFAQTSTCQLGPSTLAAGASCTISVTMTPRTTGDIVGELRISDDVAGSPHIVGLDGWGS